jgi:hypothetical protein
MTRITLTYLEKIQEERKDNLRTYRQDWKEYNRKEAEDEKSIEPTKEYKIYQGDKLIRTRVEEQGLSRRCELCGSSGFVTKRIHGLRRKINYNQKENRYECQNKSTCEERVEKFIDGRWTLTDEFWR